MPDWFAGGEGALCGNDRVQLVTVAGQPALLESDPRTETKVVLRIAARVGSRWMPTCTLSIATTARYAIQQRFCGDGDCSDFDRVATDITNASHASDDARQRLAAAEPPAAQTGNWAKIISIANSDVLLDKLLPTFDKNGCFKIDCRFSDNAILTPILVARRLLLAKLGSVGSGGYVGDDDLVALYRLAGQHLEPVAAYQLRMIARTLRGVSVGAPP